MKLILSAIALSLAFTSSLLLADDTPRSELIGRQIPNFILPTITGKEVALADYPDVELLAFIFLGTECPIGNSYIPQLNELSKTYSKEIYHKKPYMTS